MTGFPGATVFPRQPIGSAPSPSEPPPPSTEKPDTFAPAPPSYSLFDRFLHEQCKPALNVSWTEALGLFMTHPMQTFKLWRNGGKPVPGEGLAARVKMYSTIYNAMPWQWRHPWQRGAQLGSLLQKGILNNARTEDGHSVLYHLYAILATPRGEGYRAREILRETVEILDRPECITQKFKPLSKTAEQRMLTLSRAAGYPLKPDDLKVEDSATCVAASLMFVMANKEPGELARHLNELTSPMHAFQETARLDEISPDHPLQATEILRQQGIPYTFSGPNTVVMKIALPLTGIIRAVDDQDAPSGHRYRNAVETAYQSALMCVATPSYNPATDLRDADRPGEPGTKGLTEEEKSFMETTIKDNNPIQSVTYQTVAGKSNPNAGEEGNSYLYGYTRPFQKTAEDLVGLLDKNEYVIVGLTDTDAKGSITGGHEITLKQAFRDPQNGELKFVVADSDDDNPTLVVKSARELIPRIHHAGFPVKEARRIKQEIAATPGYFVPDEHDAQNFSLLKCNPEPLPPAEALPFDPASGPPSLTQAPPPPYSSLPQNRVQPVATINPFRQPEAAMAS